MMAAASMTQDNGFHMNPRNLSTLLSFFSSSLLGPNTSRRCSACASVRPRRLHRRLSNTSWIGMFSCMHRRRRNHNTSRRDQGGRTKKEEHDHQGLRDRRSP
jgi:hypothetical protein